MKTLIVSLTAGFLFCAGLSLQAAEQRPYDKELLLFTAEVDGYMDLAEQLKSEPKNSEEVYEQMNKSATRISDVYFTKMLSIPGGEAPFHSYLAQSVKQHKELQAEMVILGNVFVEKAGTLVSSGGGGQSDYRKNGLITGTIGGIVLGSSYLILKLGRGLRGADAVLIASFIAGGSAAGYFVGKAMRFSLPSDPSIQSARDFYDRFPKGEDFIQELDRATQDLKLLRSL